jgi:glycosyltransferase involved in cell wall biosynthesis
MPKPTVCVVIPTLNRPGRLRRCLKSIMAGQRGADQIIVCDQSTSRDTHDAVEVLSADHAEFSYLHLDRPHASAARNVGLNAAQTDLVAFIDDDCVAHPGWLYALTQGFVEAGERLGERRSTVGAVAGRVLPLFPRNRKRGQAVSSRTSTVRRTYRREEGGMDRGEWAPWDVGTGANILSSRETLLKIGGFDEELGPGTAARAAEDIDLLYRLSAHGALLYEPDAIIYHPASSRRGRLQSRYVYGLGMGSMLARHIATRDATAQRLLLLYVRHQLANFLRRGIWGPLETTLVLAGVGRALARQVRSMAS